MTMMDGLGEARRLPKEPHEEWVPRGDGSEVWMIDGKETFVRFPSFDDDDGNDIDADDVGSVCERVRVNLQPMNGPSGWEQCRANVRGALSLEEVIQQLLQVAPRLGNELWNDVDIVLRRSA